MPLGQGDRQEALTGADQQDGVPLQTLGRVQGGQGDSLDRRGVLGGGPLTQLGDQSVEVRTAPGAQLIRQLDDGVQGVPPLAHSAAGGRRPLAPPLPAQDHASIQADIAGEVGPLGASGGAQHDDSALDLVALEKALSAAHQVADPGVGQSALDHLGLGIGAVQDGDPAQQHAAGPQPLHVPDDAGGLRDVIIVGLEAHSGPAGPLGDELDGAGWQGQGPSPAPRAREDPVGQRDDLWGGAVVATQPDRASTTVAGGEAG